VPDVKVDEDAIDARYYETPYYLLPDGEVAEEGYVILQRALEQSDKIGVGQLILRGQGNIVALKPCGRGLMLEVLRHANEIKSADKFFEEVPDVKIDKEALDLAVELIDRKSGAFEPEKFRDEYNDAVWELINAKIEHRAPSIVTGEPGTAKIINIMDALKKSVKQQGKAAPPSKGQQLKKAAAASSRSGAAKKATRAAPKRKSA
jgi:DNA end-binding protein Ku